MSYGSKLYHKVSIIIIVIIINESAAMKQC